MTKVYVLLNDSPSPEHGETETYCLGVYKSKAKAMEIAKGLAEDVVKDFNSPKYKVLSNKGTDMEPGYHIVFEVDGFDDLTEQAWYVCVRNLEG